MTTLRTLRSLAFVVAATIPVLAGSFLISPNHAIAAQPVTVDELLAGFAKMPGLYAEFRQESFFALLSEPLVDTGTIHFSHGKLARRTLSPTLSVVIMDGTGIEFGDGQTVERIDLAGKPAIKQFVDAFTMIFAGDRTGLETLYRVEFSPGADRTWTLTLIPKVAPMNTIIAKVVVSGTELKIATMRVVEIGGDETVTTFSNVDTARKYGKADLAKLFSATL